MNIILIGAGNSSLYHLQAYSNKGLNKIVRIKYVVDPDVRKHRIFLRSFKKFFPQELPPVFLDDVSQIPNLTNKDHFIIDICSSSGSHFKVLREVVNKGFSNVIIEKPAFVKEEELKEALKFDVNLNLSENYMYSDTYLGFKKKVHQKIKEISLVSFNFSKDRTPELEEERGFFEGTPLA